jgi:hypothetical protein
MQSKDELVLAAVERRPTAILEAREPELGADPQRPVAAACQRNDAINPAVEENVEIAYARKSHAVEADESLGLRAQPKVSIRGLSDAIDRSRRRAVARRPGVSHVLRDRTFRIQGLGGAG